MYTLTARFTFKDGATAVAAVTIPSPETERPILYGGAVDRFPDRHKEGDHVTLRFWANRMARELAADVQFSESGTFDWHAQ